MLVSLSEFVMLGVRAESPVMVIRGEKSLTRLWRVGNTSTRQTGQRDKNRTNQLISPTTNFF